MDINQQGHRIRNTNNTKYEIQNTKYVVFHFRPPQNTLEYEMGREG